MTEIRVCWSIEGREDLIGRPIQGGLWSPDTPDTRQAYEIIVEEGNRAYGEGTHWMEEREA